MCFNRLETSGLQGDVVCLSWPIAPLVYEPKCGGWVGVAGSQPMNTAVHITWHGAQINFGDLTPYLTYAGTRSLFPSFHLWGRHRVHGLYRTQRPKDYSTEYIHILTRDETGSVYSICPLSWSVHCNFTGDGKCNERGWACTPHPHQARLILPSWLNVRQ